MPDYTTLYRFLKRLDDKKIDPALWEAVRRLGNTGRPRRRARVAVDATGLAQGAFSRRQYARRAQVETVFSTVKRKLSARAPGRSWFMQTRQALLLSLAFNLYRLRPPWAPLRVSTEPCYLLNNIRACVAKASS